MNINFLHSNQGEDDESDEDEGDEDDYDNEDSYEPGKSDQQEDGRTNPAIFKCEYATTALIEQAKNPAGADLEAWGNPHWPCAIATSHKDWVKSIKRSTCKCPPQQVTTNSLCIF